jgi:transcriptional regulator with XRE-family HTH domain
MTSKKNTEQLGGILRTHRERARLTLRELGKLSGVHYSNIANYENGSKIIGPETAVRLVEALGIRGKGRKEALALVEDADQTTVNKVALKRMIPDLLREHDIDVTAVKTVSEIKPKAGEKAYAVTLQDGKEVVLYAGIKG